MDLYYLMPFVPDATGTSKGARLSYDCCRTSKRRQRTHSYVSQVTQHNLHTSHLSRYMLTLAQCVSAYSIP